MTHKQAPIRIVKSIKINQLTNKIQKKYKRNIQRKQKLKEITQIIKEIDNLYKAMTKLVTALDKITISIKQTING